LILGAIVLIVMKQPTFFVGRPFPIGCYCYS